MIISDERLAEILTLTTCDIDTIKAIVSELQEARDTLSTLARVEYINDYDNKGRFLGSRYPNDIARHHNMRFSGTVCTHVNLVDRGDFFLCVECGDTRNEE